MHDDKKAVLADASDDTRHEFSFYLRDLAMGQWHITRSGLERYGARYARIGVDLRQVRAEADAEAAWQAGLRHAISDFAREAKGRCPELDRIFSTLPRWEEGERHE